MLLRLYNLESLLSTDTFLLLRFFADWSPDLSIARSLRKVLILPVSVRDWSTSTAANRQLVPTDKDHRSYRLPREVVCAKDDWFADFLLGRRDFCFVADCCFVADFAMASASTRDGHFRIQYCCCAPVILTLRLARRRIRIPDSLIYYPFALVCTSALFFA